MRFTNKFGLPDAFVRAVINDPYDNQNSDYTPSTLGLPPRASALISQHNDEIEVDVSTRVAALLGQGAHVVAERAARPEIDLVETRLFSTFMVDGREYKVSFQLDIYESDTRVIYDWKTAKLSSLRRKKSGRSFEWDEQINIGAEILRRNGHDPVKGTILAMVKDWTQFGAGQDGKPKCQVDVVDIPLWKPADVVTHIESRIRMHEAALEKLPFCSTKENWGGARCGEWCDAASVCTQYQNGLKFSRQKKALGW